MKKFCLSVASVLLFTSLSFGQFLGVTYQGSDPSGNCTSATSSAFVVNTTTPSFWYCNNSNGTYTPLGGGALSGTTIKLTATTNQLVLGTAAHTSTISAVAPAGSNTTFTIRDSVGNSNVLTSPPPISAVGTTLALTTAQCGQLVQMGDLAGEVVTLPNPAGFVGCSYDFVITISNTSNSNEIRTDGSSRFLLGAVEHSATGIAPLTFWADGTATQALKMDGAHLGGLIGSTFHVQAISSTQWEITGRNECTSVCTTGFTATP